MKKLSVISAILFVLIIAFVSVSCSPQVTSDTGDDPDNPGGETGFITSEDGMFAIYPDPDYEGYYGVMAMKRPDEPIDTYTIPSEIKGYKIATIQDATMLQDVRKIVIEDGILAINDNSFSNMPNLEELELPSSLQYIGLSAFRNSGLKSLTIPDSVTMVQYSMLAGCSNLTDLYVPLPEGSYAWNSLMWVDNVPESATIHYNYGNEGLAFLKSSEENGYICIGASVTDGNSELSIPSEYKGLPVIAIGSHAFYQNESITSITVPETVKVIENEAFHGCKSLTTINLPSSLESIGEYSFYACSNLALTELPDSLKSIGQYAFFMGYPENKSIVLTSLPSSLAEIGESAFEGINVSLTELPEKLQTIGENAFKNTPIKISSIPASVKTIGDGAFSGTLIEKVTLPETVETIGNGIFENCANLRTVYVPYVHEVSYKWHGWNNRLPDNVESKPAELNKLYYVPRFYYDENNNEVECYLVDGYAPGSTPVEVNILAEYRGLPVVKIGNDAFKDLTTIKSIEIPSSINEIGVSAFEGCTSLETIEIPEDVASLESSTFSKCTSLADVSLPSTLKSIGREAFHGCTSLKEIKLPDGLERINTGAFWATGLENIEIPASVVDVGPNAFNACHNLKTFKVAFEEGKIPDGWESSIFRQLPESCEVIYAEPGTTPGGDDNPGGETGNLNFVRSIFSTTISIIQYMDLDGMEITEGSQTSGNYVITMTGVKYNAEGSDVVLYGTYEQVFDQGTLSSTQIVNITEGSSIDGEPHTASWKVGYSNGHTVTTDIIVDGVSLPDESL